MTREEYGVNGVLDQGWLQHFLGPNCWQAFVRTDALGDDSVDNG